MQHLLAQDKDLVGAFVFNRDEKGQPRLLAAEFPAELRQSDGFSEESFRQLSGRIPELPVAELLDVGSVRVRATRLPDGAAVIALGLPIGNTRPGAKGGYEFAAIAFLRQGRLIESFSRFENLTAYLVDREGTLIAHADAARVGARENVGALEIVRQFMAGIAANGQTRYADPRSGEWRLGAYRTVGLAGLGVVTEVPEAKAFAAARQMSAVLAILLSHRRLGMRSVVRRVGRLLDAWHMECLFFLTMAQSDLKQFMGVRKVLWAVDAFMSSSELWEQTLRSIRALVQRNPAISIQPVYVLGPEHLNLSADAIEFGGVMPRQDRPAARRALDHLFEGVAIPQIARPEVLAFATASAVQAEEAVADLAGTLGADLIVASTHARSGLKRLLFGSFTESLLFHAKVPVWVVGEGMRRAPDFKHLLFPTDFTPASRAGFKYAVTMARELGARLTLFHAIPHTVEPILQSGIYLLGGGYMPLQAYLHQEIAQRAHHAEVWVDWARALGVKADCAVDAGPESIADRIIEIARDRRSSAILMQAESGPIAATLLGSITRAVMRHAECPVLALRREHLRVRPPVSRLPSAA